MNSEVLTPEEFAAKMLEICDEFDGNYEYMHIEHDYLMCELLKTLGYEEGVQIFSKTYKWYA